MFNDFTRANPDIHVKFEAFPPENYNTILSTALAGGRGGTRPDLDVVVVDNDGGGIFSFLPQAGSQPAERFERMWGTPQDADLVALARAYGADVEEIPDLARLAQVVAAGREARGVRAFIAKTDRVANVAVHQRLHAAVEAVIEAAVGGWTA